MRLRVFAACLVLLPVACFAQEPEPMWKIPGHLVIHGGGKLSPETVAAFLKFAGGADAKIVVIPTADENAEKLVEENKIGPFKAGDAASISILHTRSRDKANEAAFVEPLKKATGVWFGGGLQKRLEDAYVGTAVERELHELLKRNGVIGGTSAGAAIMSRLMIRSGNPKAELGTGLGFVSGAVVDQHFVKRERMPRLTEVLAKNPGYFGIGIDEGTAAIINGRELRVLGESNVCVCFSKSANRDARVDTLKPGALADLVACSRTALARAQPEYPSKNPPLPEVEGAGTLVIVGGGGTPPDAVKRFVEASGGPDALIAVIPTALGDDPLPVPGEWGMLQRFGAKNLKIVHAPDRASADKPEILETLKNARGIWFCGGRQWRFVDSYLGTYAEKLMHEMVKRGGAIGGSSAGATIQGDYLVRGNPLGNLQMMWEGYERGLAFLPGVAIDQHFTQRGRFKDMTEFKRVFPQIMGFGIDESTAVIVRGHALEVVGKNTVNIYDRKEPPKEGAAEYQTLRAGEKYDLKERKKIQSK